MSSSWFSFRVWVSLGAFLVSLGSTSARPMKFDIPAQPAADALIAFSKQSGMDVLYAYQDLKAVRSQPVIGDYEPDTALASLLKDTGFTATRDSGKFVVAKARPATGAVRGVLVLPNGQPAANVFVAVRETAQSTETDKSGQFFFRTVPPGRYVIVARAAGYQPLHLTDVVVKADAEVALSKETLRRGDEITGLEPYVVTAEAVTELDKYSVYGARAKPFEAGNMDIPRTIDDVQPYYIFDAKTIDQSGATNIEDFLKQRLTMNTIAITNGQTSGSNIFGNTSTINLRGVGADKTLILINGRRTAGVSTVDTVDGQPDLNGLPLSAIDRIEVLPSSASGIYGGSAIGGVVNVILKKDFAGGEIRATYDNTRDTDSPRRTASASYGLALEGGKTHVMFNASWSDAEPLLLQDRRSLLEENLATIQQNAPTFLSSAANPWLGALPNITLSSTSATATLTLKNGGGSIGSRNTFISPGTSTSTSMADLIASLRANAGKWNMELPLTAQAPTGLLRPFGVTPETRSFQASVRRQMWPRLEAYADFSYNENSSASVYNSLGSFLIVPAAAPTNPFTTEVRVRVPDAVQIPITTRSATRSATVGAIAKLPWDWTGALDYTWSENRFNNQLLTLNQTSRDADLLSGALNPFVDSLQFPLALKKYYVVNAFQGSSRLQALAARASGSLAALPWGEPTLTVGLEHRISQTPERLQKLEFSDAVASSNVVRYFARESVTDSGYAEATVPLIKRGWLAGVHALELQASARGEFYEVDTGTPFERIYYNLTPPTVTPGTPNLGGRAFFKKTRYDSNNTTVGLRYQPIPEVTLRASRATAFLPPTPAQLLINPEQSTTTTLVDDPVTGQTRVPVFTLGGGNPNLEPQNSKSVNAGIIWQPTWKPLVGLRLNAEYYKIEQFGFIGTLTAQEIVNQENNYPGRVVRDAAGRITLVDISMVNLFRRETEGWDLSADYTLKTSVGTFNLHAVESIILHLKNQYAQNQPDMDVVNSPSEGGAIKYKSNATLTWEWRGWNAGWSTRHFSAYKQYGAAGGGYSKAYANGGVYNPGTAITPQGSDTIPSQTYHDVFASYAFGRRAQAGAGRATLKGKLLDGLTVQLGVRNVFDTVPPFDVMYASNYYLSPYGDTRLRSYWLSVKKAF